MLQCFDGKICIFVTGLGVSLDSDKPHLVGIDEDVSSTGITLYHLLDGATNIGSEEKTNDIGSDLVLNISSLLSQIFFYERRSLKNEYSQKLNDLYLSEFGSIFLYIYTLYNKNRNAFYNKQLIKPIYFTEDILRPKIILLP